MKRTVGVGWLVLAVWVWSGPAASAESTNGPRLVSLAPSLTELVFAMGLESNLVGRTNICDYPEAAATLPVLGSFGRPTWEALVAVRPDYVLVTDLEKPGFLQQMQQRGMTPLVLPCENWAELQEAARQIAAAAGFPDIGEEWARRLQRELDDIEAQVDHFFGNRQRPSVYVEIWGQPITTAGRNSYLNDVIRLAGGDPIGKTLRGSYVPVSSEWLIATDPDVILLAYMLADLQGAQRLDQRPGWQRLAAIRSGRVISDIHPDQLLRPGPRLIEGTRALAERFQQLFPAP